jgi:mono/diheme cytochrome c family protein
MKTLTKLLTSMSTRALLVAVLFWAVGTTGGIPNAAGAPNAAAAAPQSAALAGDAAQHRAMLDQYCVACHNDQRALPENDPVNLQAASLEDPTSHAATWERVIRKLSVRAMPPEGARRPEEAEYVAFTNWLVASLDQAWATESTPGRYIAHRLNRVEYRNAIRDMLAVDVDITALLPADGADFGFDNIAAALRTSPLLLERYLIAAQRISTLAIGDPEAEVGTTEYSINRNFSQSGHIEGLPIGTRGGTVVTHVFPADGEYSLFGRLVRGIEEGYAGVEGNDTPDTFVITLDGAEVYSAQIGGLEDHEVQVEDMNKARPIIDERMTARINVTAGPHQVGFTFRERSFQAQDVWQPSRRDSQEIHMIGGLARLKTVHVEGPYSVTGVGMTPSRERVLVCQPDSIGEELACAEQIFLNLARRAFRRPVTLSDIEAPLEFYEDARDAGSTFDGGVRVGLTRILSSPRFLFRIEQDPDNLPAGAAITISDIELASRLSFFLWSSIPDDELLSVAEEGRLRDPGVLEAQVRRMLGDRRADSMVSDFTGQWLQLRNLEAKVQPEILLFPDFDDNTRQAFRRETEMLFAYILREDRSLLELLDADYTFVDERLAKHYGITGVYGSRFRKVAVTDPRRQGLLGHASILSLTSVANRTSPVFRGIYVLRTFLDTPPPPPPANVPALEDSDSADADVPQTVRAQMEVHRANPACASCHRTIDPVGFALENFDSVGQWRETSNGLPIDSAGQLADGTPVDGPEELRRAILARPDAFSTIITERLMTYALGRGLEPPDMAVVRSVVQSAAESDYALSSVVLGIVESEPFQMRTRLEPAGQIAQSETEDLATAP